MIVASGGRLLIGPALFPAYLRILSINVGITLIVVVLAAIFVANGQPLASTMWGVTLAILLQFAIVTAIFVAAERTIDGDSTHPTVEDTKASGGPPASWLDRLTDGLIGGDHSLVVPRRTSAMELALIAICLGWLLWIRPPIAIEFLRSGPGWEPYHVAIIVILAAASLQPIINLFRPERARLRAIVRILVDLAFLAVFALSLTTGQWVVPTNEAAATADQRILIAEISRWIGVSLAIAAGIVVVTVVLELRRLVRRRQPQRSPEGRPFG